ncbi:MAG TPA: hypothetical protein VF463_08460 [Sphingobium sp.]
MIAFAPTIARLKEGGFLHVEGLLEFVDLSEAPRVSPALFVVPERESAAPNRMSGVVDQKVTEIFSVIVVVEAQRLAGKVSEELKRHTDAVVQQLVGWRHPEASGPCEYVGGRLLPPEGRRVAWAISFNTSRHIRKESQ